MAIQSVQRALEILSIFSTAQPQLGITEISRIMELPKPTVHGLIQTLAEQGFLSQDPETRKYMLGLKIYELGTYLSGTLKINQVGSEPTRHLTNQTRKMARVAIWDKNSMLITLHLFPNNENLQFQQLGPRIPAYCSAGGKAILSTFSQEELDDYLAIIPLTDYTASTITDRHRLLQDLEQTRQRGYSTESEEYLIGMACVGAPIFDRNRRAVAAVSLSGNPDLLVDEQLPGMIGELRRTAVEISRRLGYQPDVMHS